MGLNSPLQSVGFHSSQPHELELFIRHRFFPQPANVHPTLTENSKSAIIAEVVTLGRSQFVAPLSPLFHGF
jgi:hypothetical protein